MVYYLASMGLFTDVFIRLSTLGVAAAVYEVNSLSDIQQYLPKTIRLADYSYPYIILCKEQLTKDILQQVCSL